MNKNNENEIILEPLRIALKLEKEGKQLFSEAAKNTKSKIARQTFEFLANEEDKHIAHIENFYRSLEMSDGNDCLDVIDSDAEEKLETFNKRLEAIKDEFKATTTDIEAYQMALRFENGAEEFYAEKMDEADNPRIKKFYRWLIDEETMHSRLIHSCLKFVEDPVEWFKRRKK